jgi:HEAT repeat protein
MAKRKSGTAQPKALRPVRAIMTLDDTLQALAASDRPMTAAMVYRLSDLDDSDLTRLNADWPKIPAERRAKLVKHLGEVSETNFDMDFTRVMALALLDRDADVRQAAIEANWCDESLEFLRKLIDLAQHDPIDDVRAQALSALGPFILLGEVQNVYERDVRRAQEVAIALYRDVDNPLDVRRRALEALGNSSRPEVTELIQDAYDSDDSRLRASAVFAMGRTCDNNWSEIVLDEMYNTDAHLRYEATQAAGEIELSEAVPRLGELLQDEDREVLEMAIWSLGEIGTGEAQRLLEDALERAELDDDEFLNEAIVEALENASLVGPNLRFDD